MAEMENGFEMFDAVIDSELTRRMEEIKEYIDAIDETWDPEDIVEVLTEANGILRIIAGDSEEFFEKWRYRFFQTGEGKYTIIQGNELPTLTPQKYGDARDEDTDLKPGKRKRKK